MYESVCEAAPCALERSCFGVAKGGTRPTVNRGIPGSAVGYCIPVAQWTGCAVGAARPGLPGKARGVPYRKGGKGPEDYPK